MKYRQLTEGKRYQISVLLGQGYRPADIAKSISVHRVTVYRELNAVFEAYMGNNPFMMDFLRGCEGAGPDCVRPSQPSWTKPFFNFICQIPRAETPRNAASMSVSSSISDCNLSCRRNKAHNLNESATGAGRAYSRPCPADALI